MPFHQDKGLDSPKSTLSRSSSSSSILSIHSTVSTRAQLLALTVRKTPSISSVSSSGSLKAPPYSPYEKGIPRSSASSRSSARSTPRVPTPGGNHVYSKYEPTAPTFRPVTPCRAVTDGRVVSADISRTSSQEIDSIPSLTSVSTLADDVIPSKTLSTVSSKDPELLGVVSWESPPVSRSASIGSLESPRRTPSVPSSRTLSRRGSGDSLTGVKGDSSQDSLPGLEEELKVLSKTLHSSRKR